MSAGAIDAALRSEGDFASGRDALPWRAILALVVPAGAVFGAAAGSFGWKVLGSAYSAVKAPALLVVTTVLALPFFYVLNALLGLRADFTAALRGILAAEVTLALTLAALGPVVLVLYAGAPPYPVALLAAGLCFATASLTGQLTLARHYRPLIAADRRHGVGLAAWFLLYGFVAIKLGWTLRPFVGDPSLPTTFFRPGATGENPYAVLLWTVVGVAWSAARTLAGDG